MQIFGVSILVALFGVATNVQAVEVKIAPLSNDVVRELMLLERDLVAKKTPSQAIRNPDSCSVRVLSNALLYRHEPDKYRNAFFQSLAIDDYADRSAGKYKMVSESELMRTISAVSKAPAGITDDRLRYVIGFCNLKDQNLWVNTEKAGRVSLARALRGMMVTSLLAGTDEDALEITNSIDKVTARQYVAKPSGEPQLAKNAPADQPIRVNAGGQDRLNEMLQRHISEARATYPAAKSRYLKGLAKGEIFFVTTRIKDSAGRFEQSFIRVDSVKGSKITGRIANQISLVQGYRAGDVYTLDESDVVDWTITKPDGTEEGNFVGKFLDSIQK